MLFPFSNHPRQKILPPLFLSLLVLFLIAGSILFFSCSHILPDVQAGGLNIGGLTVKDAYRTLKNASESVLEQMDLPVALPEETLTLSPDATNVRLQTCRILLAAWKAGRFGNENLSIGLLPYLKLDEHYIQDALHNYAETYDMDFSPSQYHLAGDIPELSSPDVSDSRNCPALELTLGTPTTRLNQEDTFQKILELYNHAFSAAKESAYYVDGPFQIDTLEAAIPPDLQDIYEDIHIPPVNDTLNMETYTVIPGSWGFHFDMDTAQMLTASAAYGETISIPTSLEEPEIRGENVYYQDLLGYCETPHTKDENRNHNLTLACQSMNNLILQPGEIFSYNATLGPRTQDRGYKKAGAYSGWELVQSYGGGICQGSSTIYCAALYADLEIVLRRNHGYKVGYIDVGLDATVSWNGPDFQFRNNTNFPIKITAEVSDGYVKIGLWGTEERDYYIEMESTSGFADGVIYAKSYKCKYDRDTGELISRELEARSNYAT